MTNISELMVKQGNVEVQGVIKEIGETKTFNKFGKELKVADAILEDESGSIKLTLWNDDSQRYKEGDKVKITNGYVNEFQGEKQLTAGKYGKIEKISENITENQPENEESEQEESPENEQGNREEIKEEVI